MTTDKETDVQETNGAEPTTEQIAEAVIGELLQLMPQEGHVHLALAAERRRNIINQRHIAVLQRRLQEAGVDPVTLAAAPAPAPAADGED